MAYVWSPLKSLWCFYLCLLTHSPGSNLCCGVKKQKQKQQQQKQKSCFMTKVTRKKLSQLKQSFCSCCRFFHECIILKKKWSDRKLKRKTRAYEELKNKTKDSAFLPKLITADYYAIAWLYSHLNSSEGFGFNQAANFQELPLLFLRRLSRKLTYLHL